MPDFPETDLPLKRRSKHRRVGENSTAASDENATQQSPSKSTELTCGKCTSTLFNSVEEFELHAAKEHGGLARPKGQPQDFTGLTTTHFFSVGLFSVKVCHPGKLMTSLLGSTVLCCSSLPYLCLGRFKSFFKLTWCPYPCLAHCLQKFSDSRTLSGFLY